MIDTTAMSKEDMVKCGRQMQHRDICNLARVLCGENYSSATQKEHNPDR